MIALKDGRILEKKLCMKTGNHYAVTEGSCCVEGDLATSSIFPILHQRTNSTNITMIPNYS